MNTRQRNKEKARYRPQRQIWDLFPYLAWVIYDGLTEFRAIDRSGYPASLSSYEEWNEILDKMIFSFYEILHEHPNDPHSIWWHKTWKKMEKRDPNFIGFEFDENDNCINTMPDSPQEIIDQKKEYDKKINEGLHLFADYFESLWD